MHAEWMASMVVKAGAVMEEYSWALPAHINSPSGKDPMHLDLFAAETAILMAELLDLFNVLLPETLVTGIRQRLRREMFENYANRHEDFWWAKASTNWNAVCHRGVLGSALAVEQDLDLVARIFMLSRKYLPIYLRGFGQDGACAEGPSYWQYGFGSFALLNEQLEIRSGGELSLFEEDSRIREIARYGPRISLSNFHFVNFADCPREGALNPALLTYLGERLDDDMLRAHGYRGYMRLAEMGVNPEATRCDLTYLTRLVLNCPREHSAERTIEPEDTYFRDFEILVAHGRDKGGIMWEFAAKGGNNAEQHNHNDCGSYLLNLNSEPFIIELGAPEMTRSFLKQHRYDHLAARTMGHSLPIINGVEQAAGPQYVARMLSCEMSEDHADFSLDLSACYPISANCNDLVRSFYLDKKKGRLRVKEFYELTVANSYETAIITDLPIRRLEMSVVIMGDKCSLQVVPFELTTVDRVEEHEFRDHSGQTKKISRIVLRPERLGEQKFVGYEFVIAK
ncbi:MAG: heparinase II/III family protein [Chthoniobacteraceae bacterium]